MGIARYWRSVLQLYVLLMVGYVVVVVADNYADVDDGFDVGVNHDPDDVDTAAGVAAAEAVGAGVDFVAAAVGIVVDDVVAVSAVTESGACRVAVGIQAADFQCADAAEVSFGSHLSDH